MVVIIIWCGWMCVEGCIYCFIVFWLGVQFNFDGVGCFMCDVVCVVDIGVVCQGDVDVVVIMYVGFVEQVQCCVGMDQCGIYIVEEGYVFVVCQYCVGGGWIVLVDQWDWQVENCLGVQCEFVQFL